MESRTLRQLALIDWDFVQGAETNASGLHWYPGTFVPALPAALIEALTGVGDLVFDPYAGAGTSGMAAISRGRRSALVDANPISILSSYCGITLMALRGTSAALFDRVIETTLTMVRNSDHIHSFDWTDQAFDASLNTAVSSLASQGPKEILSSVRKGAPNTEKLRDWYEPSTLNSILSTLKHIEDRSPDSFMLLLSLSMISANAKLLSSQTRSWGHLADNVRPKSFEAKAPGPAYENWLKRLRNRMLKTFVPDDRSGTWKYSVEAGNWADHGYLSSGPDATLLVTSPPYAGAIDYTLSQRLSLYFLGYSDADLSSLTKNEIGARRKRTNPGHVEGWAKTIAEAAVRQSYRINDNGYLAFVLPHKDSGRESGEQAIELELSKVGWNMNFRHDRSIRQARARQSWTSIKQETILIFSRS